MKIKKIVLILIIISLSVLIVGGFFYFKSKQLKPLVYENSKIEDNLREKVENDSNAEIPISENTQEIIAENNNVIVDDQLKKEPVESNPVETPVDNSKVEEQKKPEENILNIKERLVSWGFSSSRDRKIDTIILHSSYNVLGGDEYDLDKVIQEYKEYGVAPHYIIDRKGNILRLVKDKDVAYHAGESKAPDGRTGVNNFSIGIELINNLEDKFTSEQYEAVNDLIAFLQDEYQIKYILGHSEIAPGRKTDPWNINWEKINR